MKRPLITFSIGCLIVTAMMVPAMALAQLTPGNTGLSAAAQGSGLQTDCSGTDCLTQIVGGVINIALGFLGIVLLAILVYAGFTWMTAGGDLDKVKRAKSMLVNAVAGIIVIAASFAITSYVVTQLGTIAGGGGGSSGSSEVDCSSYDCVGAEPFCRTPDQLSSPACAEYVTCCGGGS